MTLMLIRSGFTLFMLASFLGICWWAYHRRQKPRFDEAANLPFADEPAHQRSQQGRSKC
ncbi:MAG: cbb3-type cytochrome c oxidase subunit 3 [Gammaproteobacteria bacterium]